MNDVIAKAIDLISAAIQDSTDLPTETVLDILVTANNTTGFGGDYQEAKLLVDVFASAKNSDKYPEMEKIYHFACLIFGVIFSLLSVDEATSNRQVPDVLSRFGAKSSSTRIELIRLTLHQMYDLFDSPTVTYWSLELISFIISALCLLSDFDELQEADLVIEPKIISLATNNTDNLDIPKWRNR